MKFYSIKLFCASILAIFAVQCVYCQDISLYNQYNGRNGFTFCGNTLNLVENNNLPGVPPPACTILTSSSAELVLQPNDVIESAYLYWAGSGSGDFEVTLNGVSTIAERTFSTFGNDGSPYFSAFADVTDLVVAQGAITYTLSDLDLTAVIADYCNFGGNFGGWAILVVFENVELPLCQLNVYDGMQSIPQSVNIQLTNLNVLDSAGSEIGFIAWEGDKNIALGETLTINGILIGNVLNPTNNAFNGTNSITGSETLFNMDLDIYDLEGIVNPGDTEADISLSSARDFVMMNCIVTKLINELPDATIQIMDYVANCGSRTVEFTYQVSNLDSTATLPSGVNIVFRANGQLIGSTMTTEAIPIAASIVSSIQLEIPAVFGNPVEIEVFVDLDENGQTFVNELNENNNSYSEPITLPRAPDYNNINNLTSCNLGNALGSFDFGFARNLAKTNEFDQVSLYYDFQDAIDGVNAIPLGFEAVSNVETPKTIYVRIENAAGCTSFTSFNLNTIRCKPIVYNLVAAEVDGFYDFFTVDGLENVFEYDLSIYNRYGAKVWEGNWQTAIWSGESNVQSWQSHILPAGTYFYILRLNAEEYPEPFSGFIHLTR